MKRRELIAIGGAALVSTRAHAAERVIGWISPEARETIAPFFKAFQAGLQANTPAGETVRVIERHVTGGPEAMPQAVAELQKEGVSLIVAQGGATLAVVRAKPAVPVVFAYSGDPVVAGIAQSFARPGGNATGMSFMSLELNPKRIDLVRIALPECRKVALLSNARHAGEENDIAATQRAVERTDIDAHGVAQPKPGRDAVDDRPGARCRRPGPGRAAELAHGATGIGHGEPVPRAQGAGRVGLGQHGPRRCAAHLRPQPERHL